MKLSYNEVISCEKNKKSIFFMYFLWYDGCMGIKSDSNKLYISKPLLESVSRKEYWVKINDLLSKFNNGSDERREVMRGLCLGDIFYFMTVLLKRKDANNDFVFNLCKELEAGYRKNELDNVLHLYARGHFKSSIITCGFTIRDLLDNSERTFCIFSHTRDAAKKFLSQIKREFETNEEMKELFDDVCWGEPDRESSRWSLNDGIILKRKGNPKEASVEAWGLVDRQPTGRHFSHMVYDDVVTKDSVNTPEQIEKATDGWRLSLNLDDITKPSVKRYIGTRYHYADTYKTMMDVGVNVIVKPATIDGTFNGEPVLLSRGVLERKIMEMGEVVAAAQLFLDPMQATNRGFDIEWIRYYDTMSLDSIMGMNRYIIVDPASGKNKVGKNDYTVMLVVGLGADGNYYLLYGVRDKLTLGERKDVLFGLVKRFSPLCTYYEDVGMQSDIFYLNENMDRENYRFPLIPYAPYKMKKDVRIAGLIPYFKQGKIWFPRSCMFISKSKGVMVNGVGGGGIIQNMDFVRLFIEEEYMFYPLCKHDDMLDALSVLTCGLVSFEFPQADGSIFSLGSGGYVVSGALGWCNSGGSSGGEVIKDSSYHKKYISGVMDRFRRRR